MIRLVYYDQTGGPRLSDIEHFRARTPDKSVTRWRITQSPALSSTELTQLSAAQMVLPAEPFRFPALR
jgi:hypothetical protein